MINRLMKIIAIKCSSVNCDAAAEVCTRDDVMFDALHQRVRRRSRSPLWWPWRSRAVGEVVEESGWRLYGCGRPRRAASCRSDQSDNHTTDER